MSKKIYIIQYKYDGEGWRTYDETQVLAWRDTQFSRMCAEHPKAEHRIIPKK